MLYDSARPRRAGGPGAGHIHHTIGQPGAVGGGLPGTVRGDRTITLEQYLRAEGAAPWANRASSGAEARCIDCGSASALRLEGEVFRCAHGCPPAEDPIEGWDDDGPDELSPEELRDFLRLFER